MAEDNVDEGNLDDFFAKKDKTKKKSKSKITVDEIEEKLERKLKKGKAKKSDKVGNSGSQGGVLDVRIGEDDGEWKDVEEEAEADLTGLRIQNLQISQKEQEERENAQNNENGDDPDKSSAAQGPWKQTHIKPVPVSTPASSTPAPVAEVKETPSSKDATPGSAKPAKYVPPGARAGARAVAAATAAMNTPVASIGGGPRRKKTAPNVDSQEDFPSLGAVTDNDGLTQDFEAVRGGARQMEDPALQTSKVSVDNKYKALSGSSS